MNIDFSTIKKQLTIDGIELKSLSIDGVEVWKLATYNNLLKSAIGSDKKPYNGGQGWKANTRLGSSGSESTSGATGMEVTGFMPVKDGDTIYFKNIQFIHNGTNASKCYLAVYDSSFKMIAYYRADYTDKPGVTYDTNNNLVMVKLYNGAGLSALTTNAAYFRFSADEISNNSIITVNEPID